MTEEIKRWFSAKLKGLFCPVHGSGVVVCNCKTPAPNSALPELLDDLCAAWYKRVETLRESGPSSTLARSHLMTCIAEVRILKASNA